VKVIKNAPFNGPFEFKILNYNISLRESEAKLIEVIPVAEFVETGNGNYEGVIDRNIGLKDLSEHSKTINIALVGNPNCGKTTLFNYISGSKEKVGNYSGVTVDIKKATFKTKGYTFNFYDLPGTYSLTAYSKEEIFVRKYIYKKTPDIVINVLDATSLERNLILTTQLIEMDLLALSVLRDDEDSLVVIDLHQPSHFIIIDQPDTTDTAGSSSHGSDIRSDEPQSFSFSGDDHAIIIFVDQLAVHQDIFLIKEYCGNSSSLCIFMIEVISSPSCNGSSFFMLSPLLVFEPTGNSCTLSQ
jgi:ferrous iron transport protein B